MRRILLTTALAAGLAGPAPVAGQTTTDTTAMIGRIFADLNHTDSPGCSVGIDRAGLPLFRGGYGMASLEAGAPLTEFSVLESGSVAKQFTAAAIVHLALQGKLGLDDPVRRYVPELPDYGAPVTIRMLLHHTSGVRDMWTLFALAGTDPGTRLFTMPQALRMVYRQRELNFPPNTEFLYSNSGFLLLAEIVARVSGMPLSRYSEEVFFRPLGMVHTRWRDDWNRVVPGRATAYTPVPGGFRVDMPFMSVYGAGGLLTTVGDMLRWNANLSDPQVGGRVWADTLQHPGRLTGGKDIDYGLGLFVTSYRGEREVSHGGATGGYRTFLGRWPDRRLSVAIFCNVANANPDRLAHQVVDLFMGPRPAEPANRGPAAAASDDPSPFRLEPGRLGEFAGTYYSDELDVSYTAAVTDTTLTVRIADGEVRTFTATAPDRFTGPGGLAIRFTRSKGRPDGFLLFAGRVKNLRFVRK